jgi:hypothetical protein
MAIQPVTNLRAKKDDIGDGYVQITWDDPNGTTTAFLTLKGATGTTLSRTADLASRTAVLRGGETVIVNVQNSTHSSSADSAAYTVPAGVDPPVPLTAQQHLEAALGSPCPPGTVVGKITAAPEVVVQADGSVA